MDRIERESTLEAVNAARKRTKADPVIKEEAPHLFDDEAE